MQATRTMYIENKSAGPSGMAGIRRPRPNGARHFLEDRQESLLQGRIFRSLRGAGFKANYYDVASKELYWISGPKKNGEDALYGPRPTPIDEDVREEYWTLIRKLPEKKHRKTT